LKRVGGVSEEEDEIWEEVKVVATAASIRYVVYSCLISQWTLS